MKRTGGLKRTGSLKRTGNLKRSEIKRTSSLRQKENTVKAYPRRKKPASFKDPSLRCRNPNCSRHGTADHHVIYAQEVRRRDRTLEWDARDALKLCYDCHAAQHSPHGPRLQTVWLRDCNISFAFELMGVAAADYLRRKYDDVSEPDPRIERALRDTLAA